MLTTKQAITPTQGGIAQGGIARMTLVAVGVLLLSGAGRSLEAQSLRGSRASVERMYDAAVSAGLSFYEDVAAVRRAVKRGALVSLRPLGVRTFQVATPYVRPATRRYVREFAHAYQENCGQPMVVTSAVRPETRRPWNGSALSVHPTGMAIDVRKPGGRCLIWVREWLLADEADGRIEVTEEFNPAHFHIAVLR